MTYKPLHDIDRKVSLDEFTDSAIETMKQFKRDYSVNCYQDYQAWIREWQHWMKWKLEQVNDI